MIDRGGDCENPFGDGTAAEQTLDVVTRTDKI
jgi:hypothetical protein